MSFCQFTYDLVTPQWFCKGTLDSINSSYPCSVNATGRKSYWKEKFRKPNFPLVYPTITISHLKPVIQIFDIKFTLYWLDGIFWERWPMDVLSFSFPSFKMVQFKMTYFAIEYFILYSPEYLGGLGDIL